MEETTVGFENQTLKGVTLKNLLVTIVSTASIVASVLCTYYGLKSDMQEMRQSQQSETRVNNIRIGILEQQVSLLQAQMKELKK